MEIKFNNSNSITVRQGSDGKPQYIVNMGTILYNNMPYRIDNLRIPLYGQPFFDDAGPDVEYAVVNIYYRVPQGEFIFDNVGLYEKYVGSATTPVIKNLVPIAQFVVRKEGKNYIVDHFNEYSKMATFTISDTLVQGDTGLRGPLGFTGDYGHTGVIGDTGAIGGIGHTGTQGDTGLGGFGFTGLAGATGYIPDVGLWFYLKFKSDDIVQTDYSIYERDCTWGAIGLSGQGMSGVIFTREEGIVDNCHSVVYQGGNSYYKRNIYLALTGLPNDAGCTGGSMSAWFNMDVDPIADFTWEIKPDKGLYYFRFIDESLIQPISWSWDFGDGNVSYDQNPYHQYLGAGEYVIKLIVTNNHGSATKYKLLTILSDDIWDILLDW